MVLTRSGAKRSEGNLQDRALIDDLLSSMSSKSIEDWTKSEFHQRIFKTYMKQVLTFSDTQEWTPERWVKNILTYVGENCNYQSEEMEKKQIGVCNFCSKTKTLSKNITVGGDYYVSGSHCESKFRNAVHYYDQVYKMLEYEKKSKKETLKEMLEYLKKAGEL